MLTNNYKRHCNFFYFINIRETAFVNYLTSEMLQWRYTLFVYYLTFHNRIFPSASNESNGKWKQNALNEQNEKKTHTQNMLELVNRCVFIKYKATMVNRTLGGNDEWESPNVYSWSEWHASNSQTTIISSQKVNCLRFVWGSLTWSTQVDLKTMAKWPRIRIV